tara:strand:- start:24156 stop:24326 length:171 start_codon:yes stop_codon:yes gene_type:complete
MEYYELRKGIQFRKGSAEKVTLKKWLSIWGDAKYLRDGEAEKLYYICGGKKAKESK